jgi:glycopeptide antibiotics resistance protein
LTTPPAESSLKQAHGSRRFNWGLLFFFLVCILIALLTLFPYQILPAETKMNRHGPFWLWLFEKHPTPLNMFANVLLFVPFGYGLGWWFDKTLRWTKVLALACVAGFAFSFSIELTQAFMPTRTSSWYDVLTNTAGSPIGWMLFRIFGDRIAQRFSSCMDTILWRLSARLAVGFFFFYAIAGIAASIPLSRMAMLSNWDETYPLFVGKTPKESRGWRGNVSEISIADRYVSSAEAGRVFSDGPAAVLGESLVASYKPTGAGPLSSASSQLNKTLAKRIRDTNQFTLYVVCEPSQPIQPGVSTIVAFGSDMRHANFMLDQNSGYVIFRFRTRLTDINGNPPEYRRAGVFSAEGSHKLLFTFDGATLHFYADGKSAGPAMELGPGAAFFRRLFYLKQLHTPGFRTLYYGLLFAPLGCALGFAATLGRPSWVKVACGLLLPSTLIEPVLAAASHRPFYVGNLLLGMALTLGGFVMVRLCSLRWHNAPAEALPGE